MNNPFEELIAVLTAEKDCHARLLEAANAMNTALCVRDLGAIRAATRQYDDYTCSISDLEEKRLHLSDAICAISKKRSSHANLRQVIDQAPADRRAELAALQTDLKEAILRLSKVNYSNQVRLTESLRTIAMTFDLLATQGKKSAGGYKSLGTKDQSRSTTAIVNTVV